MNYKIEFSCTDQSSIQKNLNELYGYKDNISLQIQHRGRINLFFFLISKMIEKGKIKNFGNALDIGCNAGYYTKMISDFGFKKVVGIDITPSSMVEVQRRFAEQVEKGSLSFQLENAETYTSSETYDFILCTEVIEHTTNPGKVVENIKSLLSVGGIAVITMPNKISWPYFIEYIAYKVKNKPYNQELLDHLNYPFYKSMRLFRDPSIKLIKTSGYNYLLDSVSIKLLHRVGCLRWVNKLNFYLSKSFPFKFFTQFFFVVIEKRAE